MEFFLLLFFVFILATSALVLFLRLVWYLTRQILGLILGFLAWLLETLACALYGREVVRARMELRRHLPPSPNPPSLAQ
jgi:hypothetical protein